MPSGGRRMRSGSVGNGDRPTAPEPPRGIIRLCRTRSGSLSLDRGDGIMGAGGGTETPRGSLRYQQARSVPTLAALARDALLYGLADGHTVVLSSSTVAQQVPLMGGIERPEPSMVHFLASSVALLRDESFWDGILAEASRRRILSDAFLTSLCASGLPPARLNLRGGLADVGVTDRFLVKAPPRGGGVYEEPTTAHKNVGMTDQPSQSFGSASEMIISSLHHLRLSGSSSGGRALLGDFAAGASGPSGGDDGSAVDRLVGMSDLETFLHRLSRSASHLQTLHLGPGLLQFETSNAWLGSVKAVSSSCRNLRSLRMHGLSFGGTGRSDSASSAGGASGGVGGGSSVNALFEALARNCTSLEELSLARCTGFHDRHGQALLLELRDGSMSVPNLSELDLSYTAVGGLTFSALCSRQRGGGFANGCTCGVRKLNLDGTALDLSWLQRILEAHHLEAISILSCPQLSSGPDVWSIFQKAASKPERGLVKLSSLSFELWFKNDEIMRLENTNLFEDGMHDEVEVAMSAQHADVSADESLSFDPGFGGGWSCKHCTLINEDQAHRCAACNGRRFPYSRSEEEVAADDWSESDTDEDVADSTKKPAPVFEFSPLQKCPLKKFVALLHVDDGDDGIDTTVAINCSRVATALVSKILHALPANLSELNISLPDARGFLGQKSYELGTKEISTLIRRHGQSLRYLKLKSFLIRDLDSLQELCAGLHELRCLKLFGDGHLGLPSSSILRAISPSAESNAKSGCQSLEILQLCILDAVGDGCLVVEDKAGAKVHDEVDVIFHAPFLKRLWLQGCNDIGKLDLVTPSIERLSVVGCAALAQLGFHDSGSSNPLEHMRLSSNAAMQSHAIASLNLPKLVQLDVDGMMLVEDWEFGSLVSASQSLTTLRLKQCRSLGDVKLWLQQAFQPLSVLELRRPSAAFDLHTLQSLFCGTARNNSNDKDGYSNLRDLTVEGASGLKGFISAPRNTSVHSGVRDTEGAIPEDDRLTTLLSNSSISRVGVGAIDEESGLASTEMLGGRGIERLLMDFLESARNGGSSEYGFPPTLNAFQRKLVHDAAEGLNLEHESVRFNTGAKVVRVRRRANGINIFSDVNEVEGNTNIVTTGQDEVNVESQTTPSNLELALLAPPSIGVTFSPVRIEQEEDQADGAEVENEIDGVFALDEDTNTIKVEEQAISAAGQPHLDAGPGSDEEGQVKTLHKARSRREQRKAKKAARKGVSQNGHNDNADDEISDTASDGEDENQDEIAFDPLLQCERFARYDPKMLRRLVAVAHKLPVDRATGKAVCIRYIRGSCPYQKARNGGACRYAHFDVKTSQVKKFVPLIDYVCGRAEDQSTGGRGGKGASRRRSHDRHQQDSSASYGSNVGSLGSDSGAQMMEAQLCGRGSGRRGRGGGRRRKGSIGNEEDDAAVRLSRSYGTGDASDDGMCSRGSSPRRSDPSDPTLAISNSPGVFDASRASSFSNTPPPLNLHRLLCLELVGCDGLSGASLDGSCLARLCFRGCSNLAVLDLQTPQLTTIDVSECRSLQSISFHDDSMRGLRVANLTGCRSLNEAFMARLVNHCRALRQLHIFGSGASEKASNSRVRQKVKTKAGLAKLTAGRPKLNLVTTKKEWRVLQAKREGMACFSYEEEDGARLESFP